MKESIYKKLECLFAWASFYSNGQDLAKPTLGNKQKFNKIQSQIIDLQKQIK